MLTLWKKIQEKGLPNSPRKETADFTSLGPRYDGPLKCFDVSLAEDIVPLEKCRLLPQFEDIFDNRVAYLYFKYFLESKMVSEVLPAWHETDDDEAGDRDDSSEAPTAAATTMSNGFQLRLSHRARRKLRRLIAIERDENRGEAKVAKATDTTSLENILSEYWNEFIRSEWYCRYQIDLLTSRSVTLGDILLHEIALSYFMQFLETEGCHHVLEFWLAATNFEQLVRTTSSRQADADSDQVTNDAISIYEKYLSLLATSPLGFNDSVRCAVEEAICDEMRGPHADSFELAVNIALTFLRKRYLPAFLSSQHYVHLLSDMIRHCASVMNQTLSSSASYSAAATATAAAAIITPNQHHLVASGSIVECDEQDGFAGTQSFCTKLDPESVWRRRKQSGLSFGRVDQLGRYCRDIEPDPGRSDKSRISKMMKKWIQKNVARIEEEMAWQVAEMVIKDITDLTMGNEAAEHSNQGVDSDQRSSDDLYYNNYNNNNKYLD